MPDQIDEETQELRGRLADPAVPPRRVSAELLDVFCDPHELSPVPEEVERTPEHPAALTFAAGVAGGAGGRRPLGPGGDPTGGAPPG